jgi:hypothetical protein
MQPTNEAALKLLEKISLEYFELNPAAITPFTHSMLRWKVDHSAGRILLNGEQVNSQGQMTVSPESTRAYVLAAYLEGYSRTLGSVTLKVDLEACRNVQSIGAPSFLILGLSDEVNKPGSDYYFRDVPIAYTEIGFQTVITYGPSTPIVIITPNQLYFKLQLAKHEASYLPDPSIDIEGTFNVAVVPANTSEAFSKTKLIAVNQNVSADVSVPPWVWGISPIGDVALKIKLDEATKQAIQRGYGICSSLASGLLLLVEKPPGDFQLQHAQLFVTGPMNQFGECAFTFCPASGPQKQQ